MEIKDVKEKIKHILMTNYDVIMEEKISEQELRQYIDKIIDMLNQKEKELLSNHHVRNQLIQEIIDAMIGFGPLKPFLEDPQVTEIMINSFDRIFIEKEGKMQAVSSGFSNEQELMGFIHKLVSATQRRLDETNPYVDFSLSDGSRVNIILPPLALDGPAITIRKFLRELNTIEDLVARNTLNSDMAQFLLAAVKAKCNILFSGGTGTGKTTTMNILSQYIDKKERIITIEDTSELRLNQDNIVRLETRQANVEGRGEVTIRDLFINSLRMRPDRIILGEIRGQEALDMLMAILSGHNGSMAIIHSGSPQEVISRIETMIAMSSVALPLWVIRKQISDGLDLIVHQAQMLDGSRKITHITEVGEYKNEEVQLYDIFVFEYDESLATTEKIDGRWRKTGKIPKFIHSLQRVEKRINEDFFKEKI